MKNALLALAVTGLLLGCKTSPTGRTQLALYSDSDMNSMGAQSFNQLKQSMAINTDAKTNRYVQCIADNIIAVLPQKYASQQWEVVVFEEETPLELIKAILPDVMVKGGDYTIDQVVGGKEVIANGGKVIINPIVEGFSTTGLIEKMKG